MLPIRTSVRLFDQFDTTLENSVPGNSARAQRLWKGQKKISIDEKDSSRAKYQKSHFIKKVSNRFNNQHSSAWYEVAIMEFYRLLIPVQPKHRLCSDRLYNYYVRSVAIDNGETFATCSAESNLEQRISNEYYGTASGFRGLGSIDCIGAFILSDQDINNGNYIFDNHNQVYKIDGEIVYIVPFGLADINSIEMKGYQLLDARNEFYLKELNRTLLYFLLLPDDLIRSFGSQYGLTDEQQTVLLYNQFFLRKLFFVTDFPLSSFFKDYINSEEAIHDVDTFTNHLQGFKIVGKKRLLNERPDLQTALLVLRDENDLNWEMLLEVEKARTEMAKVGTVDYMKLARQFKNLGDNDVKPIDIDNILKQLPHSVRDYGTFYNDFRTLLLATEDVKKCIEDAANLLPAGSSSFEIIKNALMGVLFAIISLGTAIYAYGGISMYQQTFFQAKPNLKQEFLDANIEVAVYPKAN